MDQTEKAKKLFQEAIDLPEAERAAFLDDRCDDSAVRREVDALLLHHDPDSGFLLATNPKPKDASLPDELGDFVIEREIGRGGMGVVYLAEEVPLNRKVALKVLAPHIALSEGEVARFRQEARSAAGLNHPNIIPVYRFGEEEGVQYIASEYVEGITLAEKLRQQRRDSGASGAPDAPTQPATSPGPYDARSADQSIPAIAHDKTRLSEVVSIVAAIADALEFAHRHSIIHRDVKPSNILIDEHHQARLTDFGLAKNLREKGLSRTGLAGTPHYMSPEQAMARRVKIDHRTDIFSLGVVLYEVCAMRRPFGGDTSQEILHQITFEDPPRVRALDARLPRDLETIILKAIEKNPDDRYQRAGHLAADLRCQIADDPIMARPPSLARRARRVLGRHRTLAASLVVAVAAALTGFLAAGPWMGDDATLRVTADREAVVRLDPVEGGEVIELGSVPLVTEVAAGAYVVIVEAPGFGSSELHRVLVAGERYVLHARIRRDAAATQGMTRIAAGPAVIGMGRSVRESTAQSTVELEAFWIDPHEVSNGAYRGYLDATGRPAPAHWPALPDERWNGLPVVGVSYEEALAFAEWQGKRLPTAAEWERAARTEAGWEFPWGDALPPKRARELANVSHEPYDVRVWRQVAPQMGDDVLSDLRRYYLAHVVPAEHMPAEWDDKTDDLLHMLGNVAEWTSTAPQGSAPNGKPEPDYFHRIVKGDHWGRSRAETQWTLAHEMYAGVDGAAISRGFRCAKTARP